MMKGFMGRAGSFDCSAMMERFRGKDGSVDCGKVMENMRKAFHPEREEPKKETAGKEEVRQEVRKSYGRIARQESDGCWPGASRNSSTPGSRNPEQVSNLVGYSTEELASVPEGANLGLGCGNPVAIASLREGETVVDLGSGGGMDCFLAAARVGGTGRVIGVDMTPDMISLARKKAEEANLGNVQFRLGEIEHLPVADGVADAVISNCVVNLSPDKGAAYREAFRVLKPGGRLSISDILAKQPLPEEVRSDLALVSACIGGAATVKETRRALSEAGFTDIRITDRTPSREKVQEMAPESALKAMEFLMSATIEAVKPSL